jgi:hypothetical protein
MPATIARPDNRPYSPAQERFVRNLAQERVTPVAGSTATEAAIIARFEDILGNAPEGHPGRRFVSVSEARVVTEWLKSLPYAARTAAPVATNDFQSMITELRALPKSKYIVTGDAGQPVHVEVVERNHRVYLNLLLGAPGDWRRQRTSVATARALIAKIMTATYTDAIGRREITGPEAAAVRFSREHTCCAACMSPLSDTTQPGYARGLGPVCVTRFGFGA